MRNIDLRWSKKGSPLGLPTIKKRIALQEMAVFNGMYSRLSRSFTARGFLCVDTTKGIRLKSLSVTKLPQCCNENTCLTLVKHSYI